jgi:hypothetical protein
MTYYTHALQFPYTNTILNFKEIDNEQYTGLLKSNTNLPPEYDYRVDYHQSVLTILTESLKDKSKIYDLNIIEYLMFCIRLRTISIGHTIELAINTDKDKNAKVIINFFDLLKSVYDISENINEYKVIKEDDIEIHLNWPMLKDEEFFLSNASENQLEKFLRSLPLFIEKVIIKDKEFNFKKFSAKEKNSLLEAIPASVKNIIQTNVLSLLKKVSAIPLFEIEEFSEYKLEFYNATIQDLVRFIFSGNEKNILQENIFLKKYNFSLDEINKMTPIEKTEYIHYFVEQIKQSSDLNSTTKI